MASRQLLVAAGIAVSARLLTFLAAIWLPIPNERGYLVSPLLPPGYYDYGFYLHSLARYTVDPAGILRDFVSFYESLTLPVAHIVSGPVFPLLIGVTGYSAGNYLPLSLIYLGLSAATAIAWLWWLERQGVRRFWLVLFALLPQPIWFMLVISTDFLFAAEFAAFFLAYFAARPRPWIWVPALALTVLTRPNSLSVLLFVVVMELWRAVRLRESNWARLGVTLVVLLGAGLYLYPYFLTEMAKAGTSLEYFGRTPAAYVSGLFPDLPVLLDKGLSWLALIGAKLLYFVGLRPSYGVTPWPLVLTRALPGLILLPGLFLLAIRAPWPQRLLVALYCLPFLLGPSQDRYYLAIYPILFLYGTQAYEAVFAWWSRWAPGARSTRRASP